MKKVKLKKGVKNLVGSPIIKIHHLNMWIPFVAGYLVILDNLIKLKIIKTECLAGNRF